MWLKWLGGMMILATCVMWGRQKGRVLGQREELLQDFLQFCHSIEMEISYGQTPLAQIFSQWGKRLSTPAGKIAAEAGRRLSEQSGATLPVIWQGVLTEFMPRLALKQEDLAVVKTIGNELGLTYSGEQLKKLQLIEARLQEQIRAAHEERLKMEKVWQALGWCGGMMLVLVLM